jgi:hypothetical protein
VRHLLNVSIEQNILGVTQRVNRAQSGREGTGDDDGNTSSQVKLMVNVFFFFFFYLARSRIGNYVCVVDGEREYWLAGWLAGWLATACLSSSKRLKVFLVSFTSSLRFLFFWFVTV